eukprot:scaffold733_cov267-Pinguiococcus_pyrenoidosus.AAC.15
MNFAPPRASRALHFSKSTASFRSKALASMSSFTRVMYLWKSSSPERKETGVRLRPSGSGRAVTSENSSQISS